MKKLLERIRNFFGSLRPQPILGGLEISDTTLRFAIRSNNEWSMTGVRLQPGVLVGGKVINKEEFLSALLLLREQIIGPKKKSKKQIGVIVTLGSAQIYTQIFNLPKIEGANLEKAVRLNLQIASPVKEEEAYAGWQVLGDRNAEGVTQIEALAAFADRGMVNDFVGLLRDAKFIPVAIEPGSLSLVRAVREVGDGFNEQKPYVVMGVMQNGVDIVVIRHGNLHFDYFSSWKDSISEGEDISAEVFRNTIIRNLNRVINFYNAHWKEPVDEVLISAGGLQDETAAIIKENFGIPARPLVLRVNPPVDAGWVLTIGAGLRGIVSRRKDRDMSLSGIDAREEFNRERVTSFIKLWRILMPAALGILLLVFLGTSIFLGSKKSALATQVRALPPLPEEVELLRQEALVFNDFIALFKATEGLMMPRASVLVSIQDRAAANAVSINRLMIPSGEEPGTISGSSGSQDAIRSFEGALSKDPIFRDVNLPLANIRQEGGSYVFSLSFAITSSNTE